MTFADISLKLLADWVPSLPAAVGTSLVGWPPYLLEIGTFLDGESLVLRQEVRRTERQWKSVLSWMLGVAGARHVLGLENYRWIAPVSAFYPNAVKEVDLATWHPSFPKTAVIVKRRTNSKSPLCPDYIALRSTAQAGAPYEWAVAEAKGSDRAIANLEVCPRTWSKQVRNVTVWVNGARVNVPRCIVICTRVNPNAARERSRRIQIRAWNQNTTALSALPADAAVEIAAAHLFGFMRSLALRETARAIAISTVARQETRGLKSGRVARDELASAAERAGQEIQRNRRMVVGIRPAAEVAAEPKPDRVGVLDIELSDPLTFLLAKFTAASTAEEAAIALREADATLDGWVEQRRATADKNTAVSPFGVEVRLPGGFEPR